MKFFDERKPRWRQAMLPLTRLVTIDNRRRLVLIPSRMDAENERAKLQRQHGKAMLDPKISKNGKGPTGTYTLAYTLREIRTEELF
jgi:hypothetical protein